MNLDSFPVVKAVEGVKFMQVEGGSAQHLGWLGNWYVEVGTEDQREGYDPDLPWVVQQPRHEFGRMGAGTQGTLGHVHSHRPPDHCGYHSER